MYDWHRAAPDRTLHRPHVVDETLRDGLQSPSVADPPASVKVALLHHMASVGIDAVSIGLPAAGPRAEADAMVLARAIVDGKLALEATAAARTTAGDVAAIARVSERAGAPIVVYAFVGSSPIRQYVEDWDLAFLVRSVTLAGDAARRAGLPLRLVTEDTTRTPPSTLATLFAAAVDAGATGLCLCDTVGHAAPHGVAAVVAFARQKLEALGAAHVRLDWHGHNDRGLALMNALAAVRAGVDRVHGTALGLGERTGNTRIDHLLLALAEMRARAMPPEGAIARYNAAAGTALGEGATFAGESRAQRQPAKRRAIT